MSYKPHNRMDDVMHDAMHQIKLGLGLQGNLTEAQLDQIQADLTEALEKSLQTHDPQLWAELNTYNERGSSTTSF